MWKKETNVHWHIWTWEGGAVIFCLKKLRNAQMCKHWNWEINILKLQENWKGLQFWPVLKQLFLNFAYCVSSIAKSTQPCYKSKSYGKKKIFLSWCCPKIFIIFSILITVASDWQISSRAIETFQNGPFLFVIAVTPIRRC